MWCVVVLEGEGAPPYPASVRPMVLPNPSMLLPFRINNRQGRDMVCGSTARCMRDGPPRHGRLPRPYLPPDLPPPSLPSSFIAAPAAAQPAAAVAYPPPTRRRLAVATTCRRRTCRRPACRCQPYQPSLSACRRRTCRLQTRQSLYLPPPSLPSPYPPPSLPLLYFLLLPSQLSLFCITLPPRSLPSPYLPPRSRAAQPAVADSPYLLPPNPPSPYLPPPGLPSPHLSPPSLPSPSAAVHPRRQHLPPPSPPPSRRTHCRPAVFAEPAVAVPTAAKPAVTVYT